MNTLAKKISLGASITSLALLTAACLMPVGDGEGLTISGELPPDVVTLETVQPAFQRAGCIQCHSGSNPAGGMALNSVANARDAFFAIAGSDTTPVAAATTAGAGKNRIEPGDPDASHLYERITSSDPSIQMPPTGSRMEDSDKEMIRQWILDGALIAAPVSE